MKIYTKTGDKGETSLFGGARISKTDPRLEAYGTVDELNSCVGVALARMMVLGGRPNLEEFCKTMGTWLKLIQNQLFVVGSHLACGSEEQRKHLPALSEDFVRQMERIIDECTEKLPPLKNFILPGGSETSASLHLCRTVCRRAERAILELQPAQRPELITPTLNRLSDLFFVLARYSNYQLGVSDVEWSK